MKQPIDLDFPAAAVAALVALVRKQNERERAREWASDVTVERKQLEVRVAEIERVRLLLLSDSLLRDSHDDREYLYDNECYGDKRPGHRNTADIAADLADIQESIKATVAELPATMKRALPLAALGFMYLWLEQNDSLPACSDTSPEVELLVSICERAGVFRTPDRVRRALSAAIKECDRHELPRELDELRIHLKRADLSSLGCFDDPNQPISSP